MVRNCHVCYNTRKMCVSLASHVRAVRCPVFTSRRGPTSKRTLISTQKKTFASNLCARPCSTRVGWSRLACGLVAVQVGAVRVRKWERSRWGRSWWWRSGWERSLWGPKFRAIFSLSRPSFLSLPISEIFRGIPVVSVRFHHWTCLHNTHVGVLWTSREAPGRPTSPFRCNQPVLNHERRRRETLFAKTPALSLCLAKWIQQTAFWKCVHLAL